MKTKTKNTDPVTVVTLWKNNNLDEEYTMPIDEFTSQFFAWLRKQKKDWCNYYGSRVAVCEFIGKELQSAADFDASKGIDVYTDLSKIVHDEFWRIVEQEL